MSRLEGKIAVVTGASSGIGAACAVRLADAGARVIVAARREQRLIALRDEIVQRHGPESCGALEIDLRDRQDVRASVARIVDAGWGEVDILVNNAGLAAGLSDFPEGDFDDWDRMIDTNIKGLLNITRLLVPGMVARGGGHIVNIGSISGREVYPRGAVYCGTKYFVRALNRGLRLDTVGQGIRVTSIDPGMVDTEFSLVRFHGDADKARAVYDGMTPLAAEDVAEAVVWALDRPAHVNIEEILIMPTDQASTAVVHRK